MDPDTGEQLTICPWLRKLRDQNKYICDIYDDRPDDCRYYPTTIEEMAQLECEMLESHDLANPRRAQKILDTLMADSRPPVTMK
jgi:Fe-S-cluster containining protein